MSKTIKYLVFLMLIGFCFAECTGEHMEESTTDGNCYCVDGYTYGFDEYGAKECVASIPFIAPLTFMSIMCLGIIAFSIIDRKKCYNMLFGFYKDDAWGINIARMLAIVMLITTVAVLLFEKDTMRAVLYVIPFVIIFSVSLLKKPNTSEGLPLFGTKENALIGVMGAIIVTFGFLILFGTLFHTASVMPLGSISTLEEVSNNAQLIFYNVIMTPINEEFFFRLVVFYGTMLVVTSFAATKRMAEWFPGPMFIIVVLAVSLVFSLFHIAVGDKNASDLMFLEFQSFTWITGMVLTGTVAFPIVAHMLNNALALQLTIPLIIMYFIVPLFVVVVLFYVFESQTKRFKP